MYNVFLPFANIPDDQWIEVLVRSVQEPKIQGIDFPGFPDAALQATVVGSSNENAIREAGVFYKLVKQYYGLARTKGLYDSTILDFGVGWGRFARMFARDVEYGNLYAVDVVPRMLDVCRIARVPASLAPIRSDGKLPYRDEHIDLAYAYSVFTHLPEKVCNHWIQELHRVMSPGGLLAITLEPRRFLTFCRNITNNNDSVSAWHRTLRDAIAKIPGAEIEFDKGHFVYLPTGGGPQLPADVYGDACIPRGYIESRWSEMFSLLAYIDEPGKFRQAVAVLQKV